LSKGCIILGALSLIVCLICTFKYGQCIQVELLGQNFMHTKKYVYKEFRPK